MKVATVFVGAAAVGGATFMPVAARANNNGPVSGARIRESASCKDANWLHMEHSTRYGEAPSPETTCFGFSGLFDVSSGLAHRPRVLYWECGGNNFGWINPHAGAGASFNQGTYYRKSYSRTWNSVDIFGWAGTDKCPRSGPPR